MIYLVSNYVRDNLETNQKEWKSTYLLKYYNFTYSSGKIILVNNVNFSFPIWPWCSFLCVIITNKKHVHSIPFIDLAQRFGCHFTTNLGMPFLNGTSEGTLCGVDYMYLPPSHPHPPPIESYVLRYQLTFTFPLWHFLGVSLVIWLVFQIYPISYPYSPGSFVMLSTIHVGRFFGSLYIFF